MSHPAEETAQPCCDPGRPLWPELPLNSRDDEEVSRRCFLTLLTASSAAFFLATVPFAARFLATRTRSYPKRAVAAADDIRVGEAVSFSYPEGDTPALLVRLDADTWRAFAGTCTHLGCLVRWDTATGTFICPCHNGAFEPRSGRAVLGPPPRPLPQIALRIEEGIIYAVGVTA